MNIPTPPWCLPEDVSAEKIRLQRLLKEYSHRFSGRWPELLASAPGRTELAGNHTDHNLGMVLAGAVQMDVVALVGRREDSRVVLHSQGWEKPFEVDLKNLEPRKTEEGTTEALIRGVAGALAERGYQVGGWEGVMGSTVLPGCGLSSSAAVEVLLGTVFNGLFQGGVEGKGTISPVELAQVGQRAENHWFGKPCGLMDQMASALGGVVQIDFKTPLAPEYEKLTVDFKAAGYVLGVVDTGASHADLTPQYEAVPREMKALARALGKESLREVSPTTLLDNFGALRGVHGDRALLRALHFYGENTRVTEMVDALKRGDITEWLGLVRASGSSSWRLLQNVIPTGAEKDQEMALALGVTENFLGKEGACRVHGGGFAGTIQVYIPLGRWDDYVELMEGVFGQGCVQKLKIRPWGAGFVRLEADAEVN